MPPLSLLLVSFSLFTLSAASAWGQLSFPDEHVEHTASPEETSYEAEFKFRNDGEETTTVVDIQSTCGCTVPELDKKTYAPGEEGIVKAVFTYGQRAGLQRKTIHVRTDHGSHRLSLSVTIPSKWRVEPRIQTWRVDEERAAKPIVIQFEAVTPKSVSLANYPQELFSAEAKWDAEANAFTVDFTPLSLESDRVQRAAVDVVLPDGSVESIPIYLRVQ